MIPVMQTKTVVGEGNCLNACIASIFELPLRAVNFDGDEDTWWDEYCKWLDRYDLEPILLNPDMELAPDGYHIILLESSDETIKHAVVGLRGKIVHDPHPDPNDYSMEITTWQIFARKFEKLGLLPVISPQIEPVIDPEVM